MARTSCCASGALCSQARRCEDVKLRGALAVDATSVSTCRADVSAATTSAFKAGTHQLERWHRLALLVRFDERRVALRGSEAQLWDLKDTVARVSRWEVAVVRRSLILLGANERCDSAHAVLNALVSLMELRTLLLELAKELERVLCDRSYDRSVRTEA